MTLVLCRVGRKKSLDPRGKNKRNILPPSTARTILFPGGTSSVIMHGQFLWFSARIEIFLSKNFPPFLNFASLSVVSLSSIRTHIQLAKIFLDESFFFSRETKKQNSIRFQTNFTDYKYFLPAILSINRKIKKKKKRGGNIFIIKEQRTKVKTYCIYDHEVHLFFSTPLLPVPFSSPLIRNTNNFSSSVFPVHFILFHGPLPPAENRFSGHSLP